MKDIIIKLVCAVLFIIFGFILGSIVMRKERVVEIPKNIYIEDSLKIDSLILEINNLEIINKGLKDSIKFNDSIFNLKKDEVKNLPLTDKVLLLKTKLEYYEKVY